MTVCDRCGRQVVPPEEVVVRIEHMTRFNDPTWKGHLCDGCWRGLSRAISTYMVGMERTLEDQGIRHA